MTFIFVIAVRDHVRDLVAMRPAIAVFQEFSGVVRIASSTISDHFVDDNEFKFLDFVWEGEDGGGLCGNGGGLFGVGFHELL